MAALWYGAVKPDMSLFMKPVASALKELHDEGMLYQINKHECTKCYLCRYTNSTS